MAKIGRASPYMGNGHTYFGHNSAIFGPIELIFYGNSGYHYLISIDWYREIQAFMLIFLF